MENAEIVWLFVAQEREDADVRMRALAGVLDERNFGSIDLYLVCCEVEQWPGMRLGTTRNLFAVFFEAHYPGLGAMNAAPEWIECGMAVMADTEKVEVRAGQLLPLSMRERFCKFSTAYANLSAAAEGSPAVRNFYRDMVDSVVMALHERNIPLATVASLVRSDDRAQSAAALDCGLPFVIWSLQQTEAAKTAEERRLDVDGIFRAFRQVEKADVSLGGLARRAAVLWLAKNPLRVAIDENTWWEARVFFDEFDEQVDDDFIYIAGQVLISGAPLALMVDIFARPLPQERMAESVFPEVDLSWRTQAAVDAMIRDRDWDLKSVADAFAHYGEALADSAVSFYIDLRTKLILMDRGLAARPEIDKLLGGLAERSGKIKKGAPQAVLSGTISQQVRDSVAKDIARHEVPAARIADKFKPLLSGEFTLADGEAATSFAGEVMLLEDEQSDCASSRDQAVAGQMAEMYKRTDRPDFRNAAPT